MRKRALAVTTVTSVRKTGWGFGLLFVLATAVHGDLATPSLDSPADRAEIDPGSAQLAFGTVEGATAYELQLSTEDSFAIPVPSPGRGLVEHAQDAPVAIVA